MKRWLKYGIITLIIPFFLGLIWYLFIISGNNYGEVSFNFMFIFYLLISLIFSTSGIFGCNFKQDACVAESVAGIVVIIVLYFLLGVFISWIVGKIKARRLIGKK